jgi:hypothetical protein
MSKRTVAHVLLLSTGSFEACVSPVHSPVTWIVWNKSVEFTVSLWRGWAISEACQCVCVCVCVLAGRDGLDVDFQAFPIWTRVALLLYLLRLCLRLIPYREGPGREVTIMGHCIFGETGALKGTRIYSPNPWLYVASTSALPPNHTQPTS